MFAYRYDFTRIVNGVVETKHIYAASKKNAIRKYEKEFGISTAQGVNITRHPF